jgi:hypothetical protein
LNDKLNHWSVIVLASSIALAGWFVGNGFLKGKSADRYVTVKGVSEQDVKADIAFWKIKFSATDNNLQTVQNQIKKSYQKIVLFLKKYDIQEKNIEIQRLNVADLFTDPYRSGPIKSRYIVSQTLMVRTENIDAVVKASQSVGELVDAGVILSNKEYDNSGPTYLFRRLNDLKPKMIAEATANARKSAQQFAKDSGSRITGIRRANQGIFVILPRDRTPDIMQQNQVYKTVRVVSTIEYLLED